MGAVGRQLMQVQSIGCIPAPVLILTNIVFFAISRPLQSLPPVE